MIPPTALRQAMVRTHHLPPPRFLASTRHQPTPLKTFHSAARLTYPRAGSQDKDSINRESQEYAKGGTDDQVAAMDDAAFNPEKTSPEEQKKTAGGESGQTGSNPLDVSPANQDVSKPNAPDEGGPGGSSSSTGSGPSERKRTSGKGTTPKNGGTS